MTSLHEVAPALAQNEDGFRPGVHRSDGLSSVDNNLKIADTDWDEFGPGWVTTG